MVVVASGDSVVCIACNAAWVGPCQSHEVAAGIARAMNHDPYYIPVGAPLVRRTVCCQAAETYTAPVVPAEVQWSRSFYAVVVAGTVAFRVATKLVNVLVFLVRHWPVLLLGVLSGTVWTRMVQAGTVPDISGGIRAAALFVLGVSLLFFLHGLVRRPARHVQPPRPPDPVETKTSPVMESIRKLIKKR